MSRFKFWTSMAAMLFAAMATPAAAQDCDVMNYGDSLLNTLISKPPPHLIYRQ